MWDRQSSNSSIWRGDCVPPAIERLNKEIAAALADPNIKARFAALGGTVFALSPGEFGKLLADETAKWGKVVRAANIRLE